MSDSIEVKIPRGIVAEIQKRVWFKYYRDVEDFILNAMRRTIENWEKCALAYETGEEPDAKLEVIKGQKPVPKATVTIEQIKNSKDAKPSGCPQYLGYLRQDHPEKTPIPTECIPCKRINDCLFGGE